jgi:hypothetical protein
VLAPWLTPTSSSCTTTKREADWEGIFGTLLSGPPQHAEASLSSGYRAP